MKSNKVFTKTGDSGFTSLNSGKRVPKHDIRIKAYGTIDELIAWLGLIRGITSTTDIKTTLLEIQKQLMTIAAEFSIESKKDLLKNLIPIQPIDVKHIENKIDILTAKLPPLKDFLIPGGHVLISYSHLARCVCRRAEKYITELDEEVSISSSIIDYMNRLSDYFFTLSRTFAFELDIKEIKWSGN